MGKDQELLDAARSGNVTVVEKILGQRAKRSGPLARWVSPKYDLPLPYHIEMSSAPTEVSLLNNIHSQYTKIKIQSMI